MTAQINCDISQKSKKWNHLENPIKLVDEISKKLISLTELKKILTGNLTLQFR